MKRLGVEMPSLNSYSWVRLTSPARTSVADAVVPPMSKAIRSGVPTLAPRRAAPTAPDARPEVMKKTGLHCAAAAVERPPLELPISSGALIPSVRRPVSRRAR